MLVIVDSSKKEVHVYNCNFTKNEDWEKYEEIMFIGSCGAVCHAVFEFVRLVSRA